MNAEREWTRRELRELGWEIDTWRCPDCGAVVRDQDLVDDDTWPVHDHGRLVDLIPQAHL